jgi:hypothetical protein
MISYEEARREIEEALANDENPYTANIVVAILSTVAGTHGLEMEDQLIEEFGLTQKLGILPHTVEHPELTTEELIEAQETLCGRIMGVVCSERDFYSRKTTGHLANMVALNGVCRAMAKTILYICSDYREMDEKEIARLVDEIQMKVGERCFEIASEILPGLKMIRFDKP